MLQNALLCFNMHFLVANFKFNILLTAAYLRGFLGN